MLEAWGGKGWEGEKGVREGGGGGGLVGRVGKEKK